MSWKLTGISVFDDNCYVDMQKRHGRQATIIDAIESLMKCREDVEHNGYIIVVDYGCGGARVFSQLRDAILHALITTCNKDYVCIDNDACNGQWCGTMTIWCLKPIEKLNGNLNGRTGDLRYEPYVEDWPYSECVPGEVGIITIKGVNYHIRHDREYAVASFKCEKAEDKSEQHSNEPSDKQDGETKDNTEE